MQNLSVFFSVLSILTVTLTSVFSVSERQNSSSNTVTSFSLNIHINEYFKPTLQNSSSTDFANLTQRIKNYVTLSIKSILVIMIYFYK